MKGNENCFELAGGSSYRGFKLPEVDCTHKKINNNNNNNSNNDIIRWTSEKVSANGGPLNSGLVRFTVIH